MPVIHAILPNEGGISGGTPVAIVGENFVDGMQVAFGPQLLKTIVRKLNSDFCGMNSVCYMCFLGCDTTCYAYC